MDYDNYGPLVVWHSDGSFAGRAPYELVRPPRLLGWPPETAEEEIVRRQRVREYASTSEYSRAGDWDWLDWPVYSPGLALLDCSDWRVIKPGAPLVLATGSAGGW